MLALTYCICKCPSKETTVGPNVCVLTAPVSTEILLFAALPYSAAASPHSGSLCQQCFAKVFMSLFSLDILLSSIYFCGQTQETAHKLVVGKEGQ